MTDIDKQQADFSEVKPPRSFQGLVRLLAFAGPYRLRILGAGLALIVAAAAVLVIGQAVRGVIDHGFSGASSALVDQYFLGLFGVVAVLAVATFCRFYLVTWLGERVVADIRAAVYGHVLKLSPAFFEETRTGEVLSRLTTDTTLIQTVVGSSVSLALRNILLFIGGSVMMAITSPKLTLLTALIVPLVLLPIIVFGRRVRKLSRASQDRIADISAFAGENLQAIATVQAYTQERRSQAQFADMANGAFKAAVRRISNRATLTALVMLLVFGAVDIVMWVGGKDVLSGAMSAGELTAFIFYAVVVAGGVGALSEVWGEVQAAAGAAERLGELLAAVPDIAAPDNPVSLPNWPRGSLQFEHVTFHYPARPETAALDGLSFTVEPGQTLALVGPSGAGKSTVFQLVLRFYAAQAGRIRFDDIPIEALDPIALRRKIAVVSQEPVIFAGDVSENIRYGRPEASDDEVRRAAQAAAALEFIEKLPQGFSTFLGERGVRLSGGQRQRIAIARAILRDPALLLLDEATSALDSESERAVQEALEHLMVGRTSIVIAHRLATVLKADQILVLDHGRLVAAGTHAELMAEGGLYARLAKLQFDTVRLAS